jgi:hypothetical protein
LIDLEPFLWILSRQKSHAWHENKGGIAGKSEEAKISWGRSLFISFDLFNNAILPLAEGGDAVRKQKPDGCPAD